MEMMIWNIVLSALVAIMGFMIKGKFDELDRIAMLLNKTREEVAANHVTRNEFTGSIDKIGEKLDMHMQRIEAKIDAINNRVLGVASNRRSTGG